MLRLRHSLRPCIEALDAPSAKYSLLRRNAPSITFFYAQRRLLQTAAQSPSRRAVEPPDHWKQSAQAARHKQQERAALREQRSKNGVANVPTDSPLKLGRRDPSMSDKDWNNRKRELQHLRDPLELANFVEKELGKGRLKEMLQLVKMASYSMQCVVSFNHLINHYLAKGRVSDAWKIYNDMKKRAQFPDSYTYTIILRGFSRNVQDSGVMEKTLSVYHSLYAPNSRVEPSIIHTNAALRVCARALDMDALWGIAARIPENGPASANARTYVTILNALRQSLLIGGEKGEREEKLAARRESAIVEGRRLWEGIIRRWRNADIVMDEELVCAMGRLLLIGRRPRDWDDVLSLVQQTMDLPRLVPRLGTAEREKADVPRLRATSVPPQYRYDDDHLSPNMEPMRGEEFLPLIPPGVGNVVSNSLNYATPGNNTLSLVLEACQKVVAAKAADQYWDLLTDSHTYAVVPDINNLNMRLRLLRQNRASAAALELLKEGFVGKENQPGPGTFRIAMSICFRDKNNHNSLKHASQILRIMSSTLEDADPKVVSIYAALATAFPLAKAQDYIDALTHLHPIVKNLRLQLGVGVAEKPGSRAGATYRKGKEREETIEAIQKVYGLYDKLLHSHMIAEEQKSPFKAERARLSAFIQRIKFKNENKAWHMAGDPSEAKSSKQNELEGEGKSDV